MMQLPRTDLEAMMMQSIDSKNESEEQEQLHSDTSSVEYNLKQTLLQSDTCSQTSFSASNKEILSLNTGCNQGEESASAMFRSEEEELLESTNQFPEHSLVPESLHDRATSSIVKPTLSGESNPLNLHQTDLHRADLHETGNDFEPERGFLPVLKNRNFLTLWGGQVFSQLADKVYLVLMIALIASRFQAEDQTISGWVSSIMIASTIPAVLFGSIAGVYVDRWSKKAVLVTTNILRGCLVLSLPLLLWITKDWSSWNNLPVGFYVLLSITFLVSTLTQFFAPAEQSAIPLIVERKHLLSANSLYTTTMMASVIVGFAVGEPLLAIADHIATHFGWTAIGLGKELVVGGSYFIAGLILLRLKIQEKNRYSSTQASSNGSTDGAVQEIAAEPPHVFEDIRDGLRYLGQQHQVRGALIQLVILFSVFAALAVLAVRLAEVIPEIKASQFGFLLAAGGVGMAIGAAFIGYFGQRFSHSQLSLWGSLGMAFSLVGLAFFSHHLIPVLLLLVMLGVFSAIVGVPMQTTIQEQTPEDMRGKVFGLQNNATNIALSLPLALAGIAETFLGLRIVFLGLAALMVTGGVLTWYVSRTSLTNR
jgi:MFS family permease